MGRRDITDRDASRDSDTRPPREDRGADSGSTNTSVGRGPADGSSADTTERPDRANQSSRERSPGRRIEIRYKGRDYHLRQSEIAAMTDIGTFRSVDVRDLGQFAYGGNERQKTSDLDNLRAQGLIEEKTFFRAHKSARKLVTLTAKGQQIAREAAGPLSHQRTYHGFVKPKELDHDADLYKVYQKAARRIRERGWRVTRVKLDFELKESINRAREVANRLTNDERNHLLACVAQEHGLTSDAGAIHLPDLQVEYETREGIIERQNLELLSRNYREAGIRGKVSAGFKIYARGSDTNRIRRAMHDTGMIREVLSL